MKILAPFASFFLNSMVQYDTVPSSDKFDVKNVDVHSIPRDDILNPGNTRWYFLMVKFWFCLFLSVMFSRMCLRVFGEYSVVRGVNVWCLGGEVCSRRRAGFYLFAASFFCAFFTVAPPAVVFRPPILSNSEEFFFTCCKFYLGKCLW